MLVFTFALVGALSTNKAEAAICTITNTGALTWDGVPNLDGAGGVHGTAVFGSCDGGTTFTPNVGDTLAIPTNVVLTIGGSATVGAITIASPVATNGITIGAGTLTVTGAITYAANLTANHQTILMTGTSNLTAGSIVIPAPGAAGNSVVTNAGSGTLIVGTVALTGGGFAGRSSIDIGTGNFVSNGLVTITGGAVGIAEVTATTGFLDFNAGVTFVATLAQAKIETSGVARMQFTGTLTGAGVINHTAATTTEFVGPATINAVPTGTGFKSVEVVSGTTTLGAALTVAGLQVDSGATLANGGFLITNTGVGTGVNGFTVNGILSGTGAVTLSGASVTIAGTGTPSFTGILTLGGATPTFASTAVLTFPAISINIGNGIVVTNNGTITTTGANGIIGGNATSEWIQGTTGTLNFGGGTTTLLSTGKLTATATGNTVNYNLAGDQTVKLPSATYYNLTLSGSGIKTSPELKTTNRVTNTLTISGTAKANFGATILSTAKYLVLGNVLARKFSWGSSASSAMNKSNTFFDVASAGEITPSIGRVITSSGDIVPDAETPVDSTTPVTPTTTTTTTSVVPTLIITAVPSTPTTTTTTTTVVPGCSGGNKFNTSTGALCVNTIVKTYNLGTKTLKNGSKGASVVELQKFLNKFLKMNLKEDGALGPKTIAVIKKWQKDHGLTADGLVGAKTKAEMNKEAEND